MDIWPIHEETDNEHVYQVQMCVSNIVGNYVGNIIIRFEGTAGWNSSVLRFTHISTMGSFQFKEALPCTP